MNDDQYLLASAYLDGDLSADQRAIAEADPEVMSEVDQMLAVQQQLRLVESPTEAARQAAIAAAMEAFTVAAARPAPPINAVTRTVEFRRRPSYARYLGLAAAVVAIGLLGLVIATVLRTSDGDDASTADVTSETLVDELAGVLADESADAPAEMASNDAGRATPGSAEIAVADGADVPPPDEPAAEPAAEMTGDQLPDVLPTIDFDQPLTTPAELGAYGSYLIELRNAGTLPPTPNTPCPQQEILGSTQYVIDGLPIDVLVAVDEVERTVLAIDSDTCEELVVGPLF